MAKKPNTCEKAENEMNQMEWFLDMMNYKMTKLYLGSDTKS